MNDKQKFFAIAAGALIVGSVIGFLVKGTDKPATPPPPSQQQASSQLPAGHPSLGENGGAAQPGAAQPAGAQAPAQPINMDNIIGRIDAFLQESYPGEWKVDGEKLYKGEYLENDNFKIVDELEGKLGSGAMISIFVGEKRISTNVQQQGAGRAFDYPVPAQVVECLETGKEIDGGTSSMGSMSFAKAFLPLKDKAGKTIAVMSVSISQ